MNGFARVCVYAGSAAGASGAYAAAARELGTTLVARGCGVVYGGGSVGLMGVMADAALDAGGDVIGVIPRFLDDREIGHRGLTRLHVTESMHERKLLMADLADAFVVLPGGIGTLEEVVEMLSWSRLGLHAKPIGLLDVDGYWAPLEALLGHMAGHGFVSTGPDGPGSLLLRDAQPGALMDAMERWEPPARPRWLRDEEQT